MRLISYITNNITKKKVRTAFYLIGILVSAIGAVDMKLMVNLYSENIDDFFKPFQDYNQILERGTNFFQLLPVSSKVNETLQPEIEMFFNTSVIPAIFISRSEEFFSAKYQYFMGLSLSNMISMWGSVGLESGRWPTASNECIVGNQHRSLSNITYFNTTFDIVGVVNEAYDYTDKFITLDIQSLQNMTGTTNRVNVFYIQKDNTIKSTDIASFEANFPNLDFLTQEELNDINGDIQSFTANTNKLLTFFTSLSALIFVFALSVLSIFNRKRDFDLFYIIGTPKRKIIFMLWVENLIFIVGGALIAIPLSLGIYGIIYAYIRSSIFPGVVGAFASFKHGLRALFADFPYSDYVNTLGTITLVNLILAGLIMIVGLNKYNLGNLKEKF